MVSVPGISMELCGGTHVSNIAEIRGLKIVSEQGIASGVRRIEAVAGSAFIEYINARDAVVKQLSASLKVRHSRKLCHQIHLVPMFSSPTPGLLNDILPLKLKRSSKLP